MCTTFKVFVEFVKIVLLLYDFGFLAQRHVGSQLPDLELNQGPLPWKAKS